MAIVQISRIQHRRGRKLSGSGMPQLASGELGWAIDTQELFIGNGAVSEGAPYVGNTKILTEHDNIFTLAEQYSYKPEDALWGATAPIARSLQERLDETVSVFSFGATGDGSDQTVAIQRAIDSLYLSGEVKSRVILWFPAGEYTISNTIQVPPFATLRGAGKGKTVINAVGCNGFSTIHYDPNNPLAPVTNLNQARYIEISGMTIVVGLANKALDIQTCSNSLFKDLRLEGSWTFGYVYGDHIGIELAANTTLYTSSNNLFENIEIDSFNFGVYSNYDITNNIFRNCSFKLMNYGVAFGYHIGVGGYPSLGSPGSSVGPMKNVIESSVFDNIAKEGFIVSYGTDNISRNNKYFNVGNDQASPAAPVYANIKFNDPSNISDLDYFDRTKSLTPNSVFAEYYNVEYVAEVVGAGNVRNSFSNEITVGTHITPSPILKFPAPENGVIYVDYTYSEDSQDIVRTGTFEIICNSSTYSLSFNDDYTYVGNPLYSTSMSFTAAISDISLIKDGLTVTVAVTNTAPVSTDKFTYSIRVKS